MGMVPLGSLDIHFLFPGLLRIRVRRKLVILKDDGEKYTVQTAFFTVVNGLNLPGSYI
jgi:hypothetical protein